MTRLTWLLLLAACAPSAGSTIDGLPPAQIDGVLMDTSGWLTVGLITNAAFDLLEPLREGSRCTREDRGNTLWVAGDACPASKDGARGWLVGDVDLVAWLDARALAKDGPLAWPPDGTVRFQDWSQVGDGGAYDGTFLFSTEDGSTHASLELLVPSQTTDGGVAYLAFAYEVDVRPLDADAPSWNRATFEGTGRFGTTGPGGVRVEIDTAREVVDRGVCTEEPVAGSATVSGSGTPGTYTFDGADDCNGRFPWTRGKDAGTATWSPCGVPPEVPAASWVFALVIAGGSRRRRGPPRPASGDATAPRRPPAPR